MRWLVGVLRGKPRYMFSRLNWAVFCLVNTPLFVLHGAFQKFKTFSVEIRESDSLLFDASKEHETKILNNGRLVIPRSVLEEICVRKSVEAKIAGKDIGLRILVYRAMLIRVSRSGGRGLYQQASHPMFRGIPHHRGDDREDILTACIDKISPQTALDIGANMGQSSLTLLRQGIRTTSIEMNYLFFNILKNQTKVYPGSRVFRGSVFNLSHYRYDLVLAFSIFHHFLKTPQLMKSFELMLNNLRCSAMLFEPHEAGHGFEGAFRDFTEKEFCEFICDNSVLNRWELIGKSLKGRSIYLLTSD